MAKRGRPPTDGAKDVSYLIGASFAIGMFEEARKSGLKYEQAVEETVKRMHDRFPDENFSATELKRALSELQPKGAEEVFHFEEFEDKWGGAVKLGPRKNYRVNRKDRKRRDDDE